MPVRGDKPRALTMLCHTCTMISSVDLAHYVVSRAKDWVSVDCGKMEIKLGDYLSVQAHKPRSISFDASGVPE